jgi:ABC-type transport system involved in cytochrome bd biosynthesis fused ATPase/permease subunit
LRDSLAAARVLVGLLGRRERAWLLPLVVVRVAARLALVAVAIGLARGGAASVLVTTLSFAVLLSIQGALSTAVARASRGALARRMVDRLLAGDVLRAVQTEPNEALASTFESLYLGQQIVAEHVPGLVGDVIAAMAIGVGSVVVLAKAPGPSLPIALGAAVLGSLVLGLAFAATSRAASTAARAFEPVYDDVVTAAGGRLELVATGRDDEHRAALAEHLARWRHLATRTDALLAVAGRAPIAAASLAVGAAVWLTASLRGTVGELPLLDAAVAASAIPAFVGVVRSLLSVARDAVRVRPLIALLTSSDGPRGAPSGASLPPLPSSIQWSGVTFSYEREGAPPGSFALRDVSLEWPPGQVLVLAGPNGSGKSTLLRLLLGLARPQSGEVRVGGVELFSTDLRAWRRRVAYLPQRPYLGEDYTTVRECIRLLSRTASDADARAALERVSLWAALERAAPDDPLAAAVRTLSAGQKQRLALARVLCLQASVVILDEPDANLDRAGIEMVGELVRELRRDSMVAVAAHTAELLESGDVRVSLSDGRASPMPRP